MKNKRVGDWERGEERTRAKRTATENTCRKRRGKRRKHAKHNNNNSRFYSFLGRFHHKYAPTCWYYKYISLIYSTGRRCLIRIKHGKRRIHPVYLDSELEDFRMISRSCLPQSIQELSSHLNLDSGRRIWPAVCFRELRTSEQHRTR